MNNKLIGFIASVIFATVVVGGFFWLWQTSKNFNPNPPISDELKPIEIDSVKKDAENILSSLEKNSDIPISTPVDKMGKQNPFVSQ